VQTQENKTKQKQKSPELNIINILSRECDMSEIIAVFWGNVDQSLEESTCNGCRKN
jgi:hypothetical protein